MTVLLILLVLVPWSISRQMRVHEVTTAGLVKLPLIFAAIGVLGFGTGDLADSTDAAAYLAVSAVISIAIGLWRGAAIPIWRDQAGTLLSQGNRTTLALWALLIGIKIAMGTVASITGIFPGEHPGDIFLFIALSFAAQNLLVHRAICRRPRWSSSATSRSPAPGATST
ncbi:hypothetical protein [Conexibacter sp. CPCC 206217]|uniref:hypothetical protein n=1 Tax=Conexibacter sp. CPCC 206217 TaxID=3064574 RepID=UPI002725176D|nr:hypothetical protein [Conexibacter sp. CPCC 206217]MDO8212153.1 hypothetical protein [Conexibacter sp. CPCC 206217]